MLRIFIICLGVLITSLSYGQERAEELLSELKKEDLVDTQKVKLYHDLAESYRYSDAEKAFYYGRNSLLLAEKIDFSKGKLMANNILGQLHTGIGQYDSAEFHLNRSLILLEETGTSPGVTYNSLGNLYFYQSDYEAALNWYIKTLESSKLEKDSSAIARSYGNMGNVYYYLGDMPKVKENFLKSLEIKEILLDSAGIAHTMGNMGNLYYDEGDFDSAFYYFNTSKIIFERQGNIFGVSLCLTSLADIYLNTNRLVDAENALLKSIEYGEIVGDQHGIMRNYQTLAAVQGQRGKLAEAIKTYQMSIQLAEEMNAREYVKDGYMNLSDLQEQKGDFRSALGSYKLYHAWADSILSEKKNEAIANLLTEYRTKEIEDSLHISQQNEEIAEIKASEAEIETAKKSQQLWIALGGILILLVMVLLVLWSYREKQKANRLLEERNIEISNQKEIIEEKHAEIKDSIAYAKRIQNAILPPKRIVKEYLNDSFILYKPKDVVAGDFYWMEKKKGKILFAAADCTGHGVPGAMVSVICNNGLNRSVREHGLTDPGKILDKTREIVIQEFEKSEDEVKDGMDIALCALEGNQLEFAGAHNPLWIIRKGTTEIEEVKANKQPIGKFDDPQPYQTHSVELAEGDVFYIFSDGYADQFGGEKGKKFKSKAFKELLLEIQSLDMNEQRERIDAAFEFWKGDFEQVDDVCVIGVRM